MLEPFLNFFNKRQTSKGKNIKIIENDLMYVGGILVEAAGIDDKIDTNEIFKIKHALINFFNITEEKADNVVDACILKINEPNSLHFYTSQINKEFDYNKKVQLLEVLWEIVLSDGKIHDFESNLLRRLSGLLYLTDLDNGNAKKKAMLKIKEN